MYPGNHTESEILSVPRNLKTRPGAPETHLAYITDDEADLLEIYKPDTPHRGPHDVPNYDTWGYDPNSSGPVTGGTSEQADYGSGPDLGGAGSTTDFGGGSWGGGEDWGPGGGTDEGGGGQDTYTHYEDYYTEPTPEDIIYDDKIADYSFSTPDVRSNYYDRAAFRKDTGSEIITNSENLARMAYELTNDPKYLNQPIFVPEGMSGWQNDQLYRSILAKYKEAKATGNNELFFEAVEDLQDITAGNPNTQYFDKVSGTGWNEWYTSPTVTGSRRSGGPGPHYGGGYYGGRGGSGGGGGGSGMQVASAEGPGGMRSPWGLSDIQRRYINRMRTANRGGIVSLC